MPLTSIVFRTPLLVLRKWALALKVIQIQPLQIKRLGVLNTLGNNAFSFNFLFCCINGNRRYHKIITTCKASNEEEHCCVVDCGHFLHLTSGGRSMSGMLSLVIITCMTMGIY